MTTTRALIATLFSLALALVNVGCGNISEKKDGSVGGEGGSGAGGTTGGGGAAGSGVAGTTGAGGSSAGGGGTDGSGRGGTGGSAGGAGGSSPCRGGTDGSGNGGRGGTTGAAGRGGAGGASAGRGGTGGGNAGAGGSNAGRGGGNAGAGGSSAGRGGAGGTCACPAIYQPVCGVDGKTYSNDCEARCVNVAVAYQGMCAEECKTNADCVHYPDGVGTCCGACLPTTSPRPPTIACLVPCMTPITCTCVATKCTEMSAGAASQ